MRRDLCPAPELFQPRNSTQRSCSPALIKPSLLSGHISKRGPKGTTLVSPQGKAPSELSPHVNPTLREFPYQEVLEPAENLHAAAAREGFLAALA